MTPIDPTPFSRRHLFLTAATSGLVAALTSGADGPRPEPVTAKPQDVAEIDSILAAIYDVISGPKGRPRNWDRMRGLFVPNARLIPCRTQAGRWQGGDPAADRRGVHRAVRPDAGGQGVRRAAGVTASRPIRPPGPGLQHLRDTVGRSNRVCWVAGSMGSSCSGMRRDGGS